MVEFEVKEGIRVECDGHKGTVRYVGEVPPTQGTWYGVEWDDSKRGKHDGEHNGTRYFQTEDPKAGSFVRPHKINSGMTLEDAVRKRYQDDSTISTQVTEQLQRTINARFVEVVGMDKVGKLQGTLETLDTVVLDGWAVNSGGPSDLTVLFPRLRYLDVSNSLLPSWEVVAEMAKQLPSLRVLNISSNALELPESTKKLKSSLHHVTHLIMNQMKGYTWRELLICCEMFPKLFKLQVAYNDLSSLGPIAEGLMDNLEELDIGVNPIESWQEICHLGRLPKLRSLNVNNCKLKHIEFLLTLGNEKTSLFSSLRAIMVASNPIDLWQSLGELNKINQLEELVVSNDEKDMHFLEFTFARILSLQILNRSKINKKERRDHEVFYLKHFSDDYYTSGGSEDLSTGQLPNKEFMQKHPSYLQLSKQHGSPTDESQFISQKNQKLKDLKIEVKVITPDHDQRESSLKAFQPTTKVAKVKMMLKRQLKISQAAKISLSYWPSTSEEIYEVPMDNDMKEICFYSITSGDHLFVRW